MFTKTINYGSKWPKYAAGQWEITTYRFLGIPLK